MRTNIKLFFAAIILLFAVSCTKENIKSPSATASSADNAVALSDSIYIGAAYGGGIIFWIDTSGQHGLIAATEDQGTASWYNGTFVTTGATSSALGTGSKNTRKIIKVQGRSGDYAANLCRKYRGGGFIDWFLPSRNEIKELYKQKTIVGGFVADRYWSSTEFNTNKAFVEYFDVGKPNQILKDAVCYVRAVRTF